MEVIENTDTKRTATALAILRSIGDKFADARKYPLFLASALIGIWVVGRGFEAFSHNTVFEPNFLVYWLGLLVWILLGIFVLGAAIHYALHLAGQFREPYVVLSWAFFGVLAAVTVYISQGYRIASAGLFAAISGSTESARQAVFLLFKFFPAAPILPVNLAALKTMGVPLYMDQLMPFVLSFPYLFGFYIWSLSFGALLLMLRGGRSIKVVHLILSVAAVIIMMTLKSMSTFTNEQLIFLQVGAVILFFLQILLTYSSVRVAAVGEDGDTGDDKPFAIPPSALKFALFLLILLPILADLQNQFVLASSTRPILEELADNQSKGHAQYVTAAQVSIRSGPALGDDVVGILPNGTRVPVFDEKHGWVSIGQNKWISSKYLRPAKS